MVQLTATCCQKHGLPCMHLRAYGDANWKWAADRHHWQRQQLLQRPPNTPGRACPVVHIRRAAANVTCSGSCTATISSSSIGGGSASGGGNSTPADVLALDVEYVHLAQPQRSRLARSRIAIRPAEVCLAAPDGAIAFHSFCHPGSGAVAGACHVGGVPEALWSDAPPLAEVVAQVRAHIDGRCIVGHGLGKDLAALGVRHPRDLQVDTVACRAFQGPGGQARPLAALAQQLLGRGIRASGVHSAREDAAAVLELYLGFVAGDTAHMDAQALQELELEQILAYAQQTASRQAD